MNNDKEVQAVFDKVIEAKHYGYGTSPYMCNALHYALIAGTITDTEKKLALKEIELYLGSTTATLYCFLEAHNHPSNITVRLEIYKDWANRPKFPKKKSLCINLKFGY